MRFSPDGPLRGTLTAPPDKSLSHRAALLAAMASEPVFVRNYLRAEDTLSTLGALRSLGALIGAGVGFTSAIAGGAGGGSACVRCHRAVKYLGIYKSIPGL